MVSYYVYTLGRSKWNKLIRKSGKEIEVNPKTDTIKEQDNIFFYVREKDMNKFYGWGKAGSSVSKNIYRIRLSKFEESCNGYEIDDIFSKVFDDNTVGFKNARSFKMKFLKENKFIGMLQKKGKKALVEFKTLINDEEESEEDDSGSESDASNEKSNDDSEDGSFDTNDEGEIPIMIEPCDDFKISTKKFSKFLKHMLVCKDCRVLDNGDGNFIASFQDVKPNMTIKNINTEDNYRKYLIPVFDAYERAESFIINSRDNNIIKVYFNEMEDTMHFGCYFIVWKMI